MIERATTFSEVKDFDELYEFLVSGDVCDREFLSMTTRLLEPKITVTRVVNEQLDIIFDEILLTNKTLCGKRSMLEATLRKVGTHWELTLRGEENESVY